MKGALRDWTCIASSPATPLLLSLSPSSVIPFSLSIMANLGEIVEEQ